MTPEERIAALEAENSNLKARINALEADAMWHKPIGGSSFVHCDKCNRVTRHQGGVCRECPTREFTDKMTEDIAEAVRNASSSPEVK